ncbi:MAG: hypothetical protein V2A73_21860 [Pseudomonadota bacterium]
MQQRGLAYRFDRITTAALVSVAAIAALLPILLVRYLPLVDLPNHLGAIAIWRHFGDERFGFANHYDLNFGLVPYWGHYGFVYLFSWFLSVELANRLFMILSVLAMVTGLAALLHVHGRPRILALLSLPLYWGFPIAWGFIGYTASIGALFWGCVLLALLADSPPKRRRWLLATNAAMGFLVYLLHPITFLLWLAAVAIYVPRRSPIVGLPSLVLLLASFLLAQESGLAIKSSFHLVGRWDSPLASLRALGGLWLFTGSYRHWLAGALLLGLVLTAILLQRNCPGQQHQRQRDLRPWLLFASVLLLYFALPRTLEQPFRWSGVNNRVAIIVPMMASLLVGRGQLRGLRRLFVCLPLVAVAILWPIHVTTRALAFDRQAADFFALVDRLPYNPAVLTVVFRADDSTFGLSSWRHFPSYVQIRRGGYNPYAWNNGFPMTVKKGSVRPAPAAMNARSLDLSRLVGHWEFFLTRHEPQGVFESREDLELLEQRGAWKLWRRAGKERQ